MQVLCMASSNEPADVACPACGKQYAVYYSRRFSEECETALDAVRATLLEHHRDEATSVPHPVDIFNVPAWSGPAHMSAAALLSGAPVRRAAEDPGSGQLAS